MCRFLCVDVTLFLAGHGSGEWREHADVYPLWHHGVGGGVPQLPEPDDCKPSLLSARQQGEPSTLSSPSTLKVFRTSVEVYRYADDAPLFLQVIELRNMDAPYLLPEHIFRDKCPWVSTQGTNMKITSRCENLKHLWYKRDKYSECAYTPEARLKNKTTKP